MREDLLTMTQVLAVVSAVGLALAFVVPRVVDTERLEAPHGAPHNDRTRAH